MRKQGLAGTSHEHRQLSKSPMSQEQEPTGEWGGMGLRPPCLGLGRLTLTLSRAGTCGFTLSICNSCTEVFGDRGMQ